MAPLLEVALRPRAMGIDWQGRPVVAITPAPSLLSRPQLKACGAWSPHEPGRVKQNRTEKSVPVQCNRPEGHEGNHMTLMGSFERLAEWEPAKVVK